MVSIWSNKLGLFEPFHNNTRSCRHRSVTDPRNGKRVALKKMPNVFQSQTSSKRAYRELKMLCFFKHDNVSFSSLTDRDGLKIFTVWVCGSSLWITEFSFFRLAQVLSALDVVHPGHIDFFQEMYPSCGIENWCLYGVTRAWINCNIAITGWFVANLTTSLPFSLNHSFALLPKVLIENYAFYCVFIFISRGGDFNGIRAEWH